MIITDDMLCELFEERWFDERWFTRNKRLVIRSYRVS